MDSSRSLVDSSKESKMKIVYWFMAFAACVIIGLLIAVVVLLAVDSNDSVDHRSPDIGNHSYEVLWNLWSIVHI